MSKRIAIVIPNHLPHLNFLEDWGNEFNRDDVTVIIMQDIGEPVLPPIDINFITHSHADVKKALGKKSWIIPNHTSACRSWGYYIAWKEGFDYIFTLDNDCYSYDDDWIGGHIEALTLGSANEWFDTLAFMDMDCDNGIYPRGMPYSERGQGFKETVLNHGLWMNVPDLDAVGMIAHPDFKLKEPKFSESIPRHQFFPMCGMNLAWKRDLTPAMYFGIFGPDWGFDQYDDIWAGILMKKVVDHLSLAVRTGWPAVEHRKQSDALTNMQKQAPGIKMNEHFWKVVRDIKLTKPTITSAYRELIEKLPDTITDEVPGWTKKFKEAALIWISLFEE